MIVQVKIAIAAMSPEIFLAFGNTGIFNRSQRCKTVRGINLRAEYPPAALPSANLRLLRSHLLPKEGGYPFAAPPPLES